MDRPQCGSVPAENVEEGGNLVAAVKVVAKDKKDNNYKLVLQ
jgi:hypothetical protein